MFVHPVEEAPQYLPLAKVNRKRGGCMQAALRRYWPLAVAAIVMGMGQPQGTHVPDVPEEFARLLCGDEPLVEKVCNRVSLQYAGDFSDTAAIAIYGVADLAAARRLAAAILTSRQDDGRGQPVEIAVYDVPAFDRRAAHAEPIYWTKSW